MDLVGWIKSNIVVILLALLVIFIAATAFLAYENSRCTLKMKMPSAKSLRDTAHVSQNYYRLPRHVIPKHYKLELRPDMTTKSFSGSVAINLDVLQPTRTIQLHSNKLVTKTVEFRHNGRSIPIKSTKMSEDTRELLIVELFEEVLAGSYQISVEFEGRLDKGIVGFYQSSYKNGTRLVPTYYFRRGI